MSSSAKDFGAGGADGATGAGGQPPSAAPRTQSGTSTGEWLVNVAGDVVVPMTTGGVIENLRAGKLSERSLVWRIGMHDWTALFDVPQLRLAAGSPALPPASARVLHQQPLQAQAEARRRRDTLPFGFPVARDPASVRRPAGLSLASPSAPAPAATLANAAPEALAVYDRPAASLTFSEAARGDWSGAARASDPTTAKASSSPRSAPEQPSPAAARAGKLPRSNYPNSLAPTAADTGQTAEPRGLGQWGDRSVVFASEYRAAKATSKRRALWAALGSASIASVLTLWLVHWPALHVTGTRLIHPAQAPAERLEAPEKGSSIEAAAAPSASQAPPAIAQPLPVAARVIAKPKARPQRPKAPALSRAALPKPAETPGEPNASAPNASAPSASAPSASAPSASAPSASAPSASAPSASAPNASAPSAAPLRLAGSNAAANPANRPAPTAPVASSGR